MPSPCTVTGLLQTAADAALQGNAFVRFRLRNFSGFVPRVLGTSIIAEPQVDVLPAADGTFSATIWGNDNLDPSNTFYTVEWWNMGRITSQANYSITGTTFNLNSAAQLNPPPSPGSSGSIATLLLTNGTQNTNQQQLNLAAGSGITLGNVNGTTTISAAAAPIVWDGVTWAFQNGHDFGPFPFSFGSAIGSSSTVLPGTSQYPALKYTTGVANPSAAGFVWQSNATPFFRFVTRFRWNLQLNQLTTTRIWMGFGGGGTTPSYWEKDTLTSDFVGFRYSTAAGDTHFKCIVNLGGVQTVIDSGIAVDTNAHQFEFIQSGGVLTFFIDGIQVGSVSSGIPNSLIGPSFVVDNVATTNAVSHSLYYWKVQVTYS